jgi:hypothetical protein
MDNLTYTTQEILQILNNRFPDYKVSEGWLKLQRKGRKVVTKTDYGIYENEYPPTLERSMYSYSRINNGILYGRVALDLLISIREKEIEAKKQGKYLKRKS